MIKLLFFNYNKDNNTIIIIIHSLYDKKGKKWIKWMEMYTLSKKNMKKNENGFKKSVDKHIRTSYHKRVD